jgi:hypothetical protein
MATITIGVDIGQNRDPTAICVSEADRRTIEGREEKHDVVRHLERLPLHTRYPEVARRLAAVIGGLRERADWPPELYVDATGLGQPVIDLLKEPLQNVEPVPVYFTHGDQRTEKIEEGRRSVKLGKAWLTSHLQTLLQSRRLHLPRTREAEELIKELLEFEIHIDESANEKYGAFRVGTHDDLVTALGLATQRDRGFTNAWAWAADYMRRRG